MCIRDSRRIVDIISDVNLAYSEHARKYLHECGLPKERTYVTGSPMAEVLHANLEKIEASDIHQRLGLEKGKYLSGYQQQAPSGRMRKYYRLTRKGRELLAEKKAEWASFHRGVADVLYGGANALA